MALSPEQCRTEFEKQDPEDKRRENEFAAIILRAFQQPDSGQKRRVIVAIANTYPKHTIAALEASTIVSL